MEEIIGERHEICMGIGNAYYNAHNYLMAEKEFLRALKYKETEKVYENLINVSKRQDNRSSLMLFIDKCL